MTSTPASVDSLKDVTKRIPEFREFWETSLALITQDRSLVLITVAYLERAIEALIYYARFIELEKAEFKNLFDGDSPLASFSAKIKVGYGLGLYNKAIRDDLDTIREIRNAFAHAPTHITFDTDEVRVVCRRLKLDAFIELREPFVAHDSGAFHKGRFVLVTSTVIGLFFQAANEKSDWMYKFLMEFGVTRKVRAPDEGPDEPWPGKPQ